MFCKTVRSSPISDVPFVLLTSLDSDDAVTRGFDAGADDYLTKPVVIHELVSRIKRLLKAGHQEATRPERILLVDDSPVIRGMMLKALRSHGFQADAVEHGVAALAKLHEQKFHLMVTDYDMPHMNGLDLCIKIRQEPSTWKQIPIIFMTAREAKADEIRVRSVGVQSFINKPFNADRFLAETERVLAECRLEKQNRLLSHYFSDQAVRAGDQFRTILCIGVANFRSLTKTHDAKKLISMLNHYYICLHEILDRCSVMVDNIQENQLFVSFGNQDQGAMLAIECAKSVHKAIPELQRRAGVDLQVQTGIHSGRLIFGILDGFFLQQQTITLIGESLELAKRVQDQANPGDVILSETTFALVQSLVRTKAKGTVKTKDGVMQVFQVSD
ncbi:MAG: response regulator [Magnetococcales bacterium]|nr:response regulator [Magnetococcales bacterium]